MCWAHFTIGQFYRRIFLCVGFRRSKKVFANHSPKKEESLSNTKMYLKICIAVVFLHTKEYGVFSVPAVFPGTFFCIPGLGQLSKYRCLPLACSYVNRWESKKARAASGIASCRMRKLRKSCLLSFPASCATPLQGAAGLLRHPRPPTTHCQHPFPPPRPHSGGQQSGTA